MRGDTVGGPIRWKLHISAPPSKVFEALNSDEGRAAFWAESAREFDGVIHFEFINGMSYRSRILERKADSVFVIDYFGGVARFQLAPDGKRGTDVTLTHTDVPSEDWNEVHAGWLNVLFPLKAWICFRVDLRNHDRGRLWDDGFVDQ
ncbi:MAG TPA: SRPBCC domain-containing protein [Vicinamibacteria bacterium]|nr:SRPBCC domain-containing protein [Vicinamibacteria bacterium]